MASLVQGYNYDIFISYRQKDNKGDRWVSEFVEALKDELESTFKEDISIYFDVNPHNGLLETHDVEASLKEKLKCLLFIPIISRTYCDPNSFAWEHELKPFLEMASNDQLGLKVKLPNGNVAYRVLPVRIHDLDPADIREFESVLGGHLRGIEFIYREPGVNKPLTVNDDEKKNLNNTKYRIQVNKTANAIKEIITATRENHSVSAKIRTHDRDIPEEAGTGKLTTDSEKPAASLKRFLPAGIPFMMLLFIAAFIVYQKIFKQDTLEKLISAGEKIAVAVIPFQNMTNDTTWNIWQEGIQNELINHLTNTEELKVRQIETINIFLQNRGPVNYASLTPAFARSLSRELGVPVYICGSIKKSGSSLRLNAQLIEAKTQVVFKSFQIDGIAENILPLVDTLSRRVRDFLIMSKLENDLSLEFRNYESSNSPEAFRYFIYGNKSFYNRDFATARDWYLKALAIDTGFTVASCYLSVACNFMGLTKQGKELCLKVYKNRDVLEMRTRIMIDWLYALYYQTIYEQIRYLKQYLEIDDLNPIQHYILGIQYKTLCQFENAATELEKSLEIYHKQDLKPLWVLNYTDLGYVYHSTGHFRKEKNLYSKAEAYFPDSPPLLYRQAVLALSQGHRIEAEEYLARYKAIRKEGSASEAAILNGVASIYSDADLPDKAEEYYRQALLLEPENPVRMNNLAFHLFEKGRNIGEGMELIDKALRLDPEEAYYLDTKGWGLFKQGKYKEALEYLERSWAAKGGYDHAIYVHLEAARNSAANQN